MRNETIEHVMLTTAGYFGWKWLDLCWKRMNFQMTTQMSRQWKFPRFCSNNDNEIAADWLHWTINRHHPRQTECSHGLKRTRTMWQILSITILLMLVDKSQKMQAHRHQQEKSVRHSTLPPTISHFGKSGKDTCMTLKKQTTEKKPVSWRQRLKMCLPPSGIQMPQQMVVNPKLHKDVLKLLLFNGSFTSQ